MKLKSEFLPGVTGFLSGGLLASNIPISEDLESFSFGHFFLTFICFLVGLFVFLGFRLWGLKLERAEKELKERR